MSGLNPLFVLAPSLQEYFVDKDTGLPLDAGVVTFYRDIARTVKKNIYKLSGTAPDYTYTALPNPCILSSVGTFQDDTGADILPYYFPYDGTPETTTGIIDLYYITVTSKSPGLIPQFVREGFPNLSETGADQTTELINFIPNGQFWDHIPDLSVSGSNSIVSPGGWTFNRPSSSTAIETISFKRISSAISSPTANPRYYVQVSTITPSGGDAYKDLRINFQGVNTFASSTQQYTFYMESQTGAGPTSYNVDLYLIKNFGTGGDPQTETKLTTLTINAAFASKQHSFTFGLNTGKIIGSNDDDFVSLAIRFPVSSNFVFNSTNFILTIGAINITFFPPTPVQEFTLRSIFGSLPTPSYDGSDYYLPIVVSKAGAVYDRSQIGEVFTSIETTPPSGTFACDGFSKARDSVSAEGIPYSRLAARMMALGNLTLHTPAYGTGYQVSTAFTPDYLTNFTIANNTLGATTVSSAGTSGFTVTTSHTGNNYYTACPGIGSSIFYLINTSITVPTPQNSGFTISEARIGTVNGSRPTTVTGITTLPAIGLASKYFFFNSYNAGNLGYYVWFKVDAVGTDPGPFSGRTGIQINLTEFDSAAFVAEKIRLSLSGFQLTSIVVTGVPSAGTYFTYNSTSYGFYVWYTVDGSGADPGGSLPGRIGINVQILSSYTAIQVLTATIIAINSTYYGTPDLRGQFIRINDPEGSYDSGARYSMTPGIYSQRVGTFELDTIYSHYHSIPNFISVNATIPDQTVSSDQTGGKTGATGLAETRPVNSSLNAFIRF